jgi:hypothetical protein
VNARGLARIALGALFLVRTTALANLLPIPLAHVRGPLFGWPEAGFDLAWGGLVLPTSVRIALGVVRTVAALAFLLGIRARVAGLMAGACGFLALSQDPLGFVFTLYVLFAATMALALTDATSRLALVPDPPVDEESSTRLLAIFVASIYVYSALAKLQSEWLSGRTLLALAEDRLLGGFVATLLIDHPGLRSPAAVAVFLVELSLPALLLVPRTRRLAIVVALLLHATFEVAAHPDVMGWVMAALLLALSSSSRRSLSASRRAAASVAASEPRAAAEARAPGP